MIEKFLQWFSKRSPSREEPRAPAMDKTGAHVVPRSRKKAAKVPRPNTEVVDTDPELASEIESNGPGKNVLIRNKYVREDTGTHETLKILDDSLVDSGEESGIDPYNTGGFDRSRNWDKRFGK